VTTSAPFRFALPPSTGMLEMSEPVARLRDFLSEVTGRPTDVTLSKSYEILARNLLSGAVDGAWAPPLVCAQAEPQGATILVRAVRKGRSTYRSALVTRRGESVTLPSLRGKRAAWVDPHSVAGYLLPAAHLRTRGYDPDTLFAHQFFAGSYPAALGALLSEHADLATIHALDETTAAIRESLRLAAPGMEDTLEVLAVTDPVPSDAVVLGPQSLMDGAPLIAALLTLSTHDEGKKLLDEVFHADSFEAASKMGYRSLYAVAPKDL
jgi:phosphonate transport system substrate-binding protein